MFKVYVNIIGRELKDMDRRREEVLAEMRRIDAGQPF
jgi:hypothetical protein